MVVCVMACDRAFPNLVMSRQYLWKTCLFSAAIPGVGVPFRTWIFRFSENASWLFAIKSKNFVMYSGPPAGVSTNAPPYSSISGAYRNPPHWTGSSWIWIELILSREKFSASPPRVIISLIAKFVWMLSLIEDRRSFILSLFSMKFGWRAFSLIA